MKYTFSIIEYYLCGPQYNFHPDYGPDLKAQIFIPNNVHDLNIMLQPRNNRNSYQK